MATVSAPPVYPPPPAPPLTTTVAASSSTSSLPSLKATIITHPNSVIASNNEINGIKNIPPPRESSLPPDLKVSTITTSRSPDLQRKQPLRSPVSMRDGDDDKYGDKQTSSSNICGCIHPRNFALKRVAIYASCIMLFIVVSTFLQSP